MKKRKAPPKKKHISHVAVFNYRYHQQHEMYEPTSPYAKSSHRWHRCINVETHRVVDTCKSLVLRNTYRGLPYFRPGDTVYTIVHNGPFGTKILKDRVDSTYSFGVMSGALKEYWLRHSRASSGLEATDVFKTYHEAKFFQFY